MGVNRAAELSRELQWLKRNPAFEERPASLEEFLGPGYLDVRDRVRDRILYELRNIFGDEVTGEKPTKYPLALVTGGIGIGKPLRRDTSVLTPKGWVPIQNLSVGDEVIGANGRTTRVTGFFPQGVIPLYRVTFTDGSWVDAGSGHQWQVAARGSGGKWREGIRTTSELRELGLRRADGSYRWRIPIVEPVHFEAGEPLPLPPYTMGVLLGDGCFTKGSVNFSGEDRAIAERVQEELPDLRLVHDPKWRTWTISKGSFGGARDSNRVMAALREMGLAGMHSIDKFIPERYLRASPRDRLDLLRGLLDTDGTTNSGNRVIFTTFSPTLAEGVVELVRSLGGVASTGAYERDGSVEYHVHVAMDVCPVWIPRRVVNWRPRTNQPVRRAIKSIVRVDDDEAFCISVDAADSLYVTKDYIVTHNTTIASIVLPYLAHWALCLKDPQDFFGLLPGSRIAMMQMSTSRKQALEVVFGDIKARIENSLWFRTKYPYNPKFVNQLRFPKDIWIIPGDSAETTFEGYNVLCGILDEADSHKLTENKDYAEQGFTTISSRISSRFQDRGFLLVIGQKKSANGFVARKEAEFKEDPNAYTTSLAIWESMGDKFYADPKTGLVKKFAYDRARKQIVPKEVARDLKSENIILIPALYRREFDNNPEKALRDLAGIPPAVGDPFISLAHKIEDARDRWLESNPGYESPVRPDGTFEPWFKALDTLKRVAHIDIAYSANGDALGFAMGHVREIVDIEGELKPYIVFDLLLRVRAPGGGEIFLSEIRQIIYSLRNDLGFRLEKVTTDGFESTDTRQQLHKRRFETELVSVDKQILPYHDLREAIYENRVEFPKYMTYLRSGDTELVEIAYKELSELVDAGRKIDHPKDGSKDVADAMAGVVFTLMGSRRFRRGVTQLSVVRDKQPDERLASVGGIRHPALRPNVGQLRAPIPPRIFTPGK